MQGMYACGRWAGGQTTMVHGSLGLSVCYGSTGLPIVLSSIYTRTLWRPYGHPIETTTLFLQQYCFVQGYFIPVSICDVKGGQKKFITCISICDVKKVSICKIKPIERPNLNSQNHYLAGYIIVTLGTSLLCLDSMPLNLSYCHTEFKDLLPYQ